MNDSFKKFSSLEIMEIISNYRIAMGNYQSICRELMVAKFRTYRPWYFLGIVRKKRTIEEAKLCLVRWENNELRPSFLNPFRTPFYLRDAFSWDHRKLLTMIDETRGQEEILLSTSHFNMLSGTKSETQWFIDQVEGMKEKVETELKKALN